MVEVAPAGTADARRALEFPMADLEDAIQAVVALAREADVIVTRNIRDFRRSPVRALTPSAFLMQTGAARLAEHGGTEPRLPTVRRRKP